MAINWDRRSYTKEEFKAAWCKSLSIAQCARELDLTIYGNTYTSLKVAADDLGLTTDHMTGQGWNVGKRVENAHVRLPLEDVLIEGSSYGNGPLKKRLLAEGILRERCYAPYCSTPLTIKDPFTGEESYIRYQLDHINGVNDDNRVENLRLLCPNCHSLTKTFCRGKGVKKPRKLAANQICSCGGKKTPRAKTCRGCMLNNRRATLKCPCGETKDRRSSKCQKCFDEDRDMKIDWPNRDVVLKMIEETNYVQTGKALGVSDNAVRKFLKRTA